MNEMTEARDHVNVKLGCVEPKADPDEQRRQQQQGGYGGYGQQQYYQQYYQQQHRQRPPGGTGRGRAGSTGTPGSFEYTFFTAAFASRNFDSSLVEERTENRLEPASAPAVSNDEIWRADLANQHARSRPG